MSINLGGSFECVFTPFTINFATCYIYFYMENIETKK
jgi:hypothetical protein